jgi:hypothetical protein
MDGDCRLASSTAVCPGRTIAKSAQCRFESDWGTRELAIYGRSASATSRSLSPTVIQRSVSSGRWLGEVSIQRGPAHPQIRGDGLAGVSISLHPPSRRNVVGFNDLAGSCRCHEMPYVSMQFALWSARARTRHEATRRRSSVSYVVSSETRVAVRSCPANRLVRSPSTSYLPSTRSRSRVSPAIPFRSYRRRA